MGVFLNDKWVPKISLPPTFGWGVKMLIMLSSNWGYSTTCQYVNKSTSASQTMVLNVLILILKVIVHSINNFFMEGGGGLLFFMSWCKSHFSTLTLNKCDPSDNFWWIPKRWYISLTLWFCHITMITCIMNDPCNIQRFQM